MTGSLESADLRGVHARAVGDPELANAQKTTGLSALLGRHYEMSRSYRPIHVIKQDVISEIRMNPIWDTKGMARPLGFGRSRQSSRAK